MTLFSSKQNDRQEVKPSYSSRSTVALLATLAFCLKKSSSVYKYT